MTPPTEGGVLNVHSVGEWGLWDRPICPQTRVDPEPCSCGFVGEWESRWIYEWHKTPRGRSYPVRAGHDERCPGCGDIERFDFEANMVERFVGPDAVVRYLPGHHPTEVEAL